MRAVLLFLCVAGVAVQRGSALLPTQAASTVLDLGQPYPQLSRGLSMIKSNDEELRAYLADKSSVCTFLAPTNQALQNSATRLGKYAGKAAQDTAMLRATLRQHVIKGRALTADQLGKLGRVLTAANQTLFTWHKGDNNYAYLRRDYPILLNKTDIKAGNCIVHTIDMALVPPTAEKRVAAWLDEVGGWPPAGPQSEWAPKRDPLPESLEARELVQAPSSKSGAAQRQAGAAAGGPALNGGKTQAPGRSGSGSALAATALAMLASGWAGAALLLLL